MCFSIPLKVLKTNGNYILAEGNILVHKTKDLKIKPGDYVRILGNVVVDKLSSKDGLNVRRLIKSLNTTI